MVSLPGNPCKQSLRACVGTENSKLSPLRLEPQCVSTARGSDQKNNKNYAVGVSGAAAAAVAAAAELLPVSDFTVRLDSTYAICNSSMFDGL
jgi:hypothetical protein